MTRGLAPAARLATGSVMAAVTLPALEPFGWLDHWPGWAVYAPGGARVRLLVRNHEISRLPDELHRYVVPNVALGWPNTAPDYGEFRTDLWSLDLLSAPVYPQERFHTGAAAAVVERYRLGRGPESWSNGAVLVVQSRADRFTGERSKVTYDTVRDTFRILGIPRIQDRVGSFRLNALPRKLGGW